MNLKSFGCSFIYGSELSDDRNNRPSKLTWPALYARELDYDYECYAYPGAGNLYILEQILNQTTTLNNDLYIIGWTWIDRFDYTTLDDKWKSILPVHTSDTAKIYYKDLHSEYRDKFVNLSYIKLAIDTLQQKRIPYIMTYIDELLFDQRWHTSPAIIDLQNYIKPNITTFEGQSFLDWAKTHSYPISANWHPLEKSHTEAAKYISNLQTKETLWHNES